MDNRETEEKEAGSGEPAEIEATLAVVSENPGGLLGKIAGLSQIAGFTLIARKSRIIHDIYFDTPDLLLAEARIGLRLRRYDADLLLTIKGPSEKADASGGVRRFELEREWSEKMPALVKETLSQRGIALPRGSAQGGPPMKSMGELGLEVVQDRKTLRGIRDIVTPPGENGRILAEMALDRVTYRFQAGVAVHYEVEVEAKDPEGILPMQAVIQGLKEAFGGELRPWNHGKLVTGKAIERIMGSVRREGLIHITGNLMPAAYDLMEEAFREGR